ncbi:restriction endonuclease [Cryptosporangium arvum]|uniref:restriction endonuclease n=1 Tax=Cryptosporangium arvum TaxID=80871 RepID=UPI0004B1D64B|nr:restriction endonuclease [Cryptosporangium arvum]
MEQWPPGAPAAQSIPDWRAAEANAARWMRWLGHLDARVTADGPDKGLDVIARDAFGQVKRQVAGIGAPALQNLFGARGLRQGQLYFFTSSHYSKRAVEYADHHQIAAFTFAVETGLISPASARATVVYRAALEQGKAAAREAAARRAAAREATARRDAERRVAERRAAAQKEAQREAAAKQAAERDAAHKVAAARRAAEWAATRSQRPLDPQASGAVYATAAVKDAVAASRAIVTEDPQEAYNGAVGATGCGITILLPVALCAGGTALVYDSPTGQIVAATATGLLFIVAVTGTRAIRRRRRTLLRNRARAQGEGSGPSI